MEEGAQILEVISQYLVGLSAVTGAVVAVFGLNAWKAQSEWKVDYDLAKRALIAVYQYRDSLFSVRHPAMSNLEMKLEDGDKEQIYAGSEESARVVKAYSTRWAKHSESRRALEAILLETDAVWSSELREFVQPLRDLEHELLIYINLFLDAYHRGDTDLALEYRKIIKNRRDIIYDMMDENLDEFRKDFSKELKKTETYLRRKLGREKK